MSTKSAKIQAYLQRSISGSPVQKLLLLSNVLLMALVFTLLIAIALMVVEDKPEAKAISRISTPVGASLRWNWFSGVEVAAPVVEADSSNLVDANVNATLVGVMLSESTSSATISFNGRPEQVYHIGDKLGSSVVIEQIQAFRIIVEQNGARRQITLKKPENVMQTEEAPDSDSASDNQSDDDGFSMANMFGALPVKVDNYGSGFKLNKLSDEMKMLADIEEGDVVVDIDGIGVQALMSDPAGWIKYSGQTSLPVTVIRNGEEVVVYVNAASLSAKMLPKFGLN
ncbi:type II secretion system protein C [Gammaproteobacteria bacterium MOLA455]|nr:type II secretion system protein C [Gammaproteobacteria bacterium MOLA455]